MTTARNAETSAADFIASPGQQRVAMALALFITLVALISIPYARTPGPVITAFLPSGVTAVILLDLLTALLLLQFGRHGRPSTLMLGCAYLYTGLVVIPYLLVFPGVFAVDGQLGAGPQSAPWLWVFWHSGFPALLLIHAALLRHELRSDFITRWPAIRMVPALLATLLLVLALGVLGVLGSLATLGHDRLPVIIRQNNYLPPNTPGIGLVVVLINLAALITLWHVTRKRSVTQLWLLIAALAFLLDVAVSFTGGARYSLGLYVARINSLLCASALLGAFVFEFHRLQMRLTMANHRLAEMADTDALTDLGNRRSFDQHLAQEWARAARNKEQLGLLLLDIDHFKSYNDSHGHQAGDICLQRIAGAIRKTLRRPGDFAARYGGEEFAVILPQTDNDGVHRVAEAVRSAIEQRDIHHQSTQASIVTASVGMAVATPRSGDDLSVLLARADSALYAAKNAGRNRTHRWAQEISRDLNRSLVVN